MSKRKNKISEKDKAIHHSIASKLFRIKQNQLKMIDRRGYEIPEDEEWILRSGTKEENKQIEDYFIQGFKQHAVDNNMSFRTALNKIYYNDVDEKLLVYYANITATKMGISEVRYMVQIMENEGIRNAIIITSKPVGPDAKKELNSLIAYNIQTFLEEEMAYDPTIHILVPKHEPLSKTEQQEFLQNKNISIDQLPMIKSTDIMARYYGMRPGRIFKITRTNYYGSMVTESVAYKVIKDLNFDTKVK